MFRRGKLTDRIGASPVMLWSLFLSGILFVAIQYIASFWGFCAGIFTVMLVADTFRPALYVAINDYCERELLRIVLDGRNYLCDGGIDFCCSVTQKVKW